MHCFNTLFDTVRNYKSLQVPSTSCHSNVKYTNIVEDKNGCSLKNYNIKQTSELQPINFSNRSDLHALFVDVVHDTVICLHDTRQYFT